MAPKRQLQLRSHVLSADPTQDLPTLDGGSPALVERLLTGRQNTFV